MGHGPLCRTSVYTFGSNQKGRGRDYESVSSVARDPEVIGAGEVGDYGFRTVRCPLSGEVTSVSPTPSVVGCDARDPSSTAEPLRLPSSLRR